MGKQVRWMIRRDMTAVLGMTAASEATLLDCLTQRDVIGMVTEDEADRVAGFMVYRMCRGKLHVLHFAARNHAAGRALLAKLKGKLSSHGRHMVTVHVPERDTRFARFLANAGYTATMLRPDGTIAMRFVLRQSVAIKSICP